MRGTREFHARLAVIIRTPVRPNNGWSVGGENVFGRSVPRSASRLYLLGCIGKGFARAFTRVVVDRASSSSSNILLSIFLKNENSEDDSSLLYVRTGCLESRSKNLHTICIILPPYNEEGFTKIGLEMFTLRIAAVVLFPFSFSTWIEFFKNLWQVYSGMIDRTGAKCGDEASVYFSSIGPEFFPSAQRVITPIRQVSIYIYIFYTNFEEISDIYKLIVTVVHWYIYFRVIIET